MLDAENTEATSENVTETSAPDNGPDPAPTGEAAEQTAPAKKTTTRKSAAKKSTAKKTTTTRSTAKKAAKADAEPTEAAEASAEATPVEAQPESAEAPAKRAPRKTAAKKTAAKRTSTQAAVTAPAFGTGTGAEDPATGTTPPTAETGGEADSAAQQPPATTALLFKPPEPTAAPPRRKKAASDADTDGGDRPAQESGKGSGKGPDTESGKSPGENADKDAGKGSDRDDDSDGPQRDGGSDGESSGDGEGNGSRRRRRRGGRRRRKSGGENGADNDGNGNDRDDGGQESSSGNDGDGDSGEEGSGTRRRRRRRRAGEESDGAPDDPQNTVTKVRKPRSAEDEITALTGSTRLEAKKQRRREGREAGRRRAPIVSEAEFLARREAVDRVMVIRQQKDLTQIAVMEDKVLVEHYVARESQASLIGNVYLGRVQNVLPSMEAAFIDIGKGRNAVLYAGEVNWDALGAKDGPRKIEQVLKSGQSVLVQVTKDPVGHKGARLTSQISLPGRFLVYVPDGTTSGISRKLPDTERNRLKSLLKEIVPESAGVIVRTAAEGASEEELTRDVERLTARWDDISKKVDGGNAPQLLYGEPDLTLKVVRDLFTEDFGKLVVSGDDAWDMVEGYVAHVAPDLRDRLERYDGEDVFRAYRIDEQISKALDRKVWLPSGGSLILDRTEAMTVVDVNTGKFTGSGGNLEETVTKNNLEAAEEIVRQLRLRDIGGIVVIDFIDMVLESNRDLVLRRLVECLGRDRTRHQVAEVTSLGLVQMTRKRIGTGLLEAFSESCEHCQGRGLILHQEPIEPKKKSDDEPRRGRRGRGRNRGDDAGQDQNGGKSVGQAQSEKGQSEKGQSEKGQSEAQSDEARSGKGGADASKDGKRGSGGKGAQDGKRGQESPKSQGDDGRDARTASPKDVAAMSSAAEATTAEPSQGDPGQGEPGRSEPGQSEPGQGEPGQEKSGQDESRKAEPAAAPTGSGSAATESGSGATEPTTPARPPAAPTIVTSVRRRGARRAAGPPSGATATTSSTSPDATTEADAAPENDGAASETTGAGEATSGQETDAALPLEVDDHGVAHVPVKRRGSRRH
jgi:ribonuclease E